jgi:hypothetical protein
MREMEKAEQQLKALKDAREEDSDGKILTLSQEGADAEHIGTDSEIALAKCVSPGADDTEQDDEELQSLNTDLENTSIDTVSSEADTPDSSVVDSKIIEHGGERVHYIKVCPKHTMKELRARSDDKDGTLQAKYNELLAKEKARAEHYPWNVAVKLIIDEKGNESRAVYYLPSWECIFTTDPENPEKNFDERWNEFWISAVKYAQSQNAVAEPQKQVYKTFSISKAEQGYAGEFDRDIGAPPAFPDVPRQLLKAAGLNTVSCIMTP